MILKRNTSAALDRARTDLAALAVQIAELQRRRDAELAGDSDIDAVTTIDR